MANWLDQNYRKSVIEQINTEENKQRKAASLKQYEIFSDRMHQYVVEYLRKQFSASTVREMPVVSSINLPKRIVTQEASVYRNEPSRQFTTTNEKEIEQLNLIYDDMAFDAVMLKANQIYKLQDQACVMIIPKNGDLIARALYAHQYDVIPMENDPEAAEAYIISTFDRSLYISQDSSAGNPTGYQGNSGYNSNPDGVNQHIADRDDWRAGEERYVVWTKDYHFVMDGNGSVMGEEMASPLAQYQVMPFVDIASNKDFEFFVRSGQSLTDFGVQYCGALSDLGNIVKLQSYSQAWMSGSKELMPENLVVGVNTILKLPIDPNDKVETKFGFASPSSDLAGAANYVEMILSNFLTARGIDPKVITGKGDASKFSSGVERFLSLIEKFEASKSDFALFHDVEDDAFDIIKAWINTLIGTDQLESEYQISRISEDTDLYVKFAEPAMIQSRQEKVDAIQKEMELGLMSRVEGIMELRGVSKEMAIQIASEIDGADLGAVVGCEA
jgi:hypothetical protein